MTDPYREESTSRYSVAVVCVRGGLADKHSDIIEVRETEGELLMRFPNGKRVVYQKRYIVWHIVTRTA